RSIGPFSLNHPVLVSPFPGGRVEWTARCRGQRTAFFFGCASEEAVRGRFAKAAHSLWISPGAVGWNFTISPYKTGIGIKNRGAPMPNFFLVLPKLAKGLLKKIRRVQPLVGLQQFLQGDSSIQREVLPAGK